MEIVKSFLGFLIILTVVLTGVLIFVSLKPIIDFEYSFESSDELLFSNLEEALADEEQEELEVKEDWQIASTSATPAIVKALYFTGWTAGQQSFFDRVAFLKKQGKINAVVIDIKDYSGYLLYDTDLKEAEKYGTESIRIKGIKGLLKNLREQGIYTIARMTVFQDPILANARPDLALHSLSKIASTTNSTSTNITAATSAILTKEILWQDNSNLFWLDPASPEVWDYHIALAQDALDKGFDEINFDYIRFPSDGDLDDIFYPFWDGQTLKSEVIKSFFQHLRENLPKAKLSVDLFGQTTNELNDMGIGQILEDSFLYFDFVCPMIYPSHYANGFLGFPNPAEYPYQIVKDAMLNALLRLDNFSANQATSSATSFLAQIRPWLQDFDWKADYGPEEVRAEIEAVIEASGEHYNGFMLWNAFNVYTEEVLLPKVEENVINLE